LYLQALRHNQELRLKDAAAEVKSLDAQLAAAHGCMERAEQQAQALAASKMVWLQDRWLVDLLPLNAM